uniref:tyrosine-protein phosphatase non-receptor type 14-like isoform X2 n=1 Tax=Myxine glutinosa TaxID=7769 RepID=UPI00358FD1D7
MSKVFVLLPFLPKPILVILTGLNHRIFSETMSSSLCGLSPAEAELCYIMEAERLEGYGEESLAAKDGTGSNILLGTSFVGIFVRQRPDQRPLMFKWNSISFVSHSKSLLLLQLTSLAEGLQFQLEDIDIAKYMSRLINTRLKFYRQNENLTTPSQHNGSSLSMVLSSAASLHKSMEAASLHLPLRNAYSETHAHSKASRFRHHKNDCFCHVKKVHEFLHPEGLLPSIPLVNGTAKDLAPAPSLRHSQRFDPPSAPGSSSSCTESLPEHLHPSTLCHGLDSQISPSYRLAPEYDTVIEQATNYAFNRRSGGSCEPKGNNFHGPTCKHHLGLDEAYTYGHGDALACSQPEIPQGCCEQTQACPAYTPSYLRRPLLHLAHSQPVPAGRPDFARGPPNTEPPINSLSHNDKASDFLTTPSLPHTLSTPELPLNPQQYADVAVMLRNHLSRPPPPYTAPRPAASTPDLANPTSPGVLNEQACRRLKWPTSAQSLLEIREEAIFRPPSELYHESSTGSARQKGSAIRKRYSLEVGTCGTPKTSKNNWSLLKEMNSLSLHDRACSVLTLDTIGLPSSSNGQPTCNSVNGESHEVHRTKGLPVLELVGYPEGLPHSQKLQAMLSRLSRPPSKEHVLGNGHTPTHHLGMQTQVTRCSPMTLEARERERHVINGGQLAPCVSEPDLSMAVKARPHRHTPRERPVSEMVSLQDAFVERELAFRKQTSGFCYTKELSANGISTPLPRVRKEGEEYAARLSIDDKCSWLQAHLDQGVVLAEYEAVPCMRPGTACSTAELPENMERNRFGDVLPYDVTRVALRPSRDNPTGYINASHIKFCLGQELWHYIASQGPLPHTSHEFWQMVWEQAVCVIAMVTPEQENGQQKCHRYWPKLGSRRNVSSYGDFRVTTKFRTDSGSFATTGLRLRHLLSGQEHTIWHLHFPSWPDHGCPEDVQRFLAFLEEVQSVRRHTNSMLPPGCMPPPVLVHCSAGVGRSGVLILTELMVACIEHNERLDVPEVLGLLREQRMFMVQTFSQYCFVYQALIHFLRSARLV